MSLRHAILGILDYRPMHGYEVKRVLDLGISNFWPVNLGAIYPNLRALEAEGLVGHHTESTAEGRPDRKVYTITDEGRAELARWRKEPPQGHTSIRSPLFLKLLFARRENARDTLDWIESEIRQARARAAVLEAQLANPRAFSTFFVQFMRESGVAHLKLQVQLLEELHERVEKSLSKHRARTRPKGRKAPESPASDESEPPGPAG